MCQRAKWILFTVDSRSAYTTHLTSSEVTEFSSLSRFVSISLLLVGSVTQITKAMQLAAESRPALPRNLSPHHLSSEKSFRQILHVHTNDVDWILTNFVLHFLSRSIISTFLYFLTQMSEASSLHHCWAEILQTALACFHKTCPLSVWINTCCQFMPVNQLPINNDLCLYFITTT